MTDLVFLEPNKKGAEPFTTSRVIAEVTMVGHKKIKLAISKHKAALETFGKVVSCETTSASGQTEILYRLNEPQATLLITFLKNTPIVVAFKTELVHQFYMMRAELQQRQIGRIQLQPIRRELTDVIKELGLSQWAYKHFTDLAYIIAIGCTAAQVRKQRDAPPKASAIDYMSADEIAAVTKLQYQIGVLLELGMDYQRVKAALLNRLTLAA